MRALTWLLVFLVLLPAGVLAWLGLGSTSALHTRAAQRIGRELDEAEERLRVAGEAAARRLDGHLRDQLAEAAAQASHALPLEPASVVMRRLGRRLEVSLPTLAGAGDEAGRPEDHGLVALRWVADDGRGLYPREHVERPVHASGPGLAGLLDHLRRRADLLNFGASDLTAAMALWREAREHLPARRLRATIDVEMALLDLGEARDAASATKLVSDLERAWPGDLLGLVGRPVVRLWLLASPHAPRLQQRLTDLCLQGRLDEVPLTDEERDYLGDLAASRGARDAASRQAQEPEPVFRLEAPLPAGRLQAVISDRWAWEQFRACLAAPARDVIRCGVGPADDQGVRARRAGPYEQVRVFDARAWGGRPATWWIRHLDAARLQEETAGRKRLTLVGIGLLLALMIAGLFLVGRAVRRERGLVRLRDEFVANVSHDLRTPLTSMCLHAEMLAEGDAPPGRRREFASVVLAEGARLAALVDDLLDFEALERGARHLEPEPVDLVSAVRAAVAPYETLAIGEGVELALEVPRVGETSILADPRSLTRILSNLMSNAWKHGRPSRDGGPGRLRVEVAAEGAAPHVTVEDDGPGIPADEREAVFERFRRGRSAARVAGAGIGLALGRELAREMGGDLELLEGPHSTAFRLTLPPAIDREGA